MAFQRFEHVMAPEGTVDAMRELIEEAVRVLEAFPGLRFENLPPDMMRNLGARSHWYNFQAVPFLDKARAALGEEGSNG